MRYPLRPSRWIVPLARIASIAIFLFGTRLADANQEVALFSISVGYNHSPQKELQTLKYADDDAVRNVQLMNMLGAQSALLVHLDHESKTLYPQIQLTMPTKQALFTALTEINRRIDEAKRHGKKTIFYFFYSGHGDVDQGEGYVQLHGDRFTRTDLISLLRQSRAETNHVIVDACKSYFLVYQRGAGGARRKASGPFLPEETAFPPNTGFLLSTSSAQDSHEWEAFQAGIFSHEVRSAFRGAADVNSDGIITYEEAAAFVYTANKSVPNQRFRPRFLMKAYPNQKGDQAPLVDLRNAPARRLVFSAKLGKRFFVEDKLGIRLADLPPGNRDVSILVSPTDLLFVRDQASKTEYRIQDQKDVVVVAALTPQTSTSISRGAEHESFQQLFREPFTHESILAYRTRPSEWIDDAPIASRAVRWLRPTLGILAVATLTTGGLFTGLAIHEKSAMTDETPHETRQEINRVIQRNNTIAVTSYIVGAGMAIGYVVWKLWPQPKMKIPISSSIRLDGATTLQVKW